jgi:hypothetical protein
VKLRRLLEGSRQPKQCGLLERAAEKLKTQREAFGAQSRRNADPRQPGEVGGDGEDVGEIHLKRVVDLFAEPESGGGSGGKRHRVDLLESPAKIRGD